MPRKPAPRERKPRMVVYCTRTDDSLPTALEARFKTSGAALAALRQYRRLYALPESEAASWPFVLDAFLFNGDTCDETIGLDEAGVKAITGQEPPSVEVCAAIAYLMYHDRMEGGTSPVQGMTYGEIRRMAEARVASGEHAAWEAANA